MSLSTRDAFKVGFLAKCAEQGLSPEQMLARVEQATTLLKQATVTGMVGTLGSKLIDVLRGIGAGTFEYGVPVALAAPPILGGMAGYGLARATDIDDTDVGEVKDREVIDEYKRQTAKLLRQRAVRDYQRARQRSGRMFM